MKTPAQIPGNMARATEVAHAVARWNVTRSILAPERCAQFFRCRAMLLAKCVARPEAAPILERLFWAHSGNPHFLQFLENFK
jgi:hypothetical protein